MATGRKTVVAGQVIDPVAWGNPLWDQSIQTFLSTADRVAQFPNPKKGAIWYQEDSNRLLIWDGTAAQILWPENYARMQKGSTVVTMPANGVGRIGFVLQPFPTDLATVILSPGDTSGVPASGLGALAVFGWTPSDHTGFNFVAFTATGVPIQGGSIRVNWIAYAAYPL